MSAQVGSRFWAELQEACERIVSSVLGGKPRPTKLWQREKGGGRGLLSGVGCVEMLEDAVDWKVSGAMRISWVDSRWWS